MAALDRGVMDPAPARYVIRIHDHLGTTVLSAFPALVPITPFGSSLRRLRTDRIGSAGDVAEHAVALGEPAPGRHRDVISS